MNDVVIGVAGAAVMIGVSAVLMSLMVRLGGRPDRTSYRPVKPRPLPRHRRR